MKTIASVTAALAITACAALAAEPPEAYTKQCASCHGKDGAGHTKAGKKLEVKDLTDAAYQKGFSDEEAFKAIKEGMKGKDGSEKMKPFNEKLTDDEITAVVKYVRTLAK